MVFLNSAWTISTIHSWTSCEFVFLTRILHGTYHVPLTCQWLYEAHLGAIGQNPDYGLFYNLDLTYRTFRSTPQGYFSWMEPGRGQ